jgi:hypothetical protein
MSIEEVGTQAIEQGPSLASAVDVMPDIEMLERGGGAVDRAENGQFKSMKPDAPADDAATADAPKDDAKPAAEAADAAPAEDDEGDYIELPAEEDGAEPRRLKLDEVLTAYQKAKTLEQEVETLRQGVPPPEHYERAIAENVQKATEYLNGLKQLEQWLQPAAPSTDLINPQSPNYDPDLYYQQLTQAQQMHQMRQQLVQERERVETEATTAQQAALEARMTREWNEALKHWPELKEQTHRQQVVKDFSSIYGFSEAEVRAIGDHRVLRVLKDALAFRKGQSAQETAIKAVKAKPKLVKATARSTQTGRQAQFAAANDRLSKSHSIEDAAEAIGSLLG